MPVVTRRELLEAGVHFGHQTRRWNPKMQRFLYGERSGIYIIDLEKSLAGLEEAYAFVRDLGRRRGHRAVRRHEEAGAGGRRRAGRARRHAVREPPLARRHAHELPDHLRPAAAPAGAARDGALRRHGVPPEEGGHPAPAREGEARAQPRRHPGHGAAARRALRDRHEEGAHRRQRGPQAGHPGRSRSSTRTATPTRSTTSIPGNDDAIRAVHLVTRVVADAARGGLRHGEGRHRGAGHRRPEDRRPHRPYARRPPRPRVDETPSPEDAAKIAASTVFEPDDPSPAAEDVTLETETAAEAPPKPPPSRGRASGRGSGRRRTTSPRTPRPADG